MVRIYIDHPILKEHDTVSLNAEQSHYLNHVMRLHLGSPLIVFQEVSGEWNACIDSISKKCVQIQIYNKRRLYQRFAFLGLAFSLVKKDTLFWILEKGTELGVTNFFPLLTKHSSARTLPKDKAQRYIIEASEQCERLCIPKLHELQELTTWIRNCGNTNAWAVALERKSHHPSLSQLFEHIPSLAGIIVGPEGGFSDEEKKILETGSGVYPIMMGHQILRSETACIYGLSVIQEERMNSSKINEGVRSNSNTSSGSTILAQTTSTHSTPKSYL
jgi:16S rRNA (uracil1498-N3)-methyltransferase